MFAIPVIIIIKNEVAKLPNLGGFVSDWYFISLMSSLFPEILLL